MINMVPIDKSLTDLGWLNAGGETARKIDAQSAMCRKVLHHTPKGWNEGNSGTVHVIACDDCKYIYRVDSGD